MANSALSEGSACGAGGVRAERDGAAKLGPCPKEFTQSHLTAFVRFGAPLLHGWRTMTGCRARPGPKTSGTFTLPIKSSTPTSDKYPEKLPIRSILTKFYMENFSVQELSNIYLDEHLSGLRYGICGYPPIP